MRRVLVADWGPLVILAALAVALTFRGSGYDLQVLTSLAIFVVLALGWNIISGLTGYVSFGQVTFFGIGAYVAAVLIVDAHLPWYGAVALAGVGGAAVAVPLGAIMLRLRGIFFALGMFGLARLGQLAATSMGGTGGPMGETVPTSGNAIATALAIIALATLAVVVTHAIMRSRLGLQLLAIRDDETAARGAGVNADGIKVIAFAISACLAALAGALYVWNIGYVDPSSAFAGTIELQTILMVLVGGIGTKWGPVIGAITISLLGQVLWAQFPLEEDIMLGAITIFVVLVAPGGIVSFLNRFGWLKRRPIWAPQASALGAPRIEAATGASSRHSNNDVVLQGQHLVKHFGGVMAVNDVDINVKPGEIHAVIGPNGAGKSTLFDLLSGFARPSEGTVRFSSRDITGLKPHRVARMGIARTFQTSRVFSTLTIWETVLVASSSVHFSRREASAQTVSILHKVGLLDMWESFPERLSPGQQRLLEIARALVLNPRVILLDEAMAGMTQDEIGRVHGVLREAVSQGRAVVAIEHVLPAIAPLADEVQVLDFGKTIALGQPAEVLTDPIVVEAYLGVGEASEAILDARL